MNRMSKRKLQSTEIETSSSQKIAKQIDYFSEFWDQTIDEIGSSQLSDLKARTKSSRKTDLPGLGASSIYKGIQDFTSFSDSSDLSNLGWNDGILQNMTSLLEETEVDEKNEDQIEAERQTILKLTAEYRDLLAISNDQDGYRSIYCAHIIQHLIRNKNLIIGNKRKLEIASVKEGGADEETIESCRDSGFVRPVVLILCPFKKDAYDIINRIRKIVNGNEEAGEVWNKNRFEEEYSGSTELPTTRADFPEDHKELLLGNNDDAFRIGIALSKKVLKLYEKFEKADILVCSPLGLRMILNGDDGNEAHLISSINLTIVDRTDIMIQQNWENVQLIFSHLHSLPSKIDVDISRVRKLYLDGHSKFYSQLLMFSRYSHEIFTSLMLQNSHNHRGLIVSRPKKAGTLNDIEVPLCQELHKFEVKDPNETSDLRFKYFVDKIMPSMIPRTVIVIPSYFDFVRVRNHLKKAEESFVMCHEYASRSKVDRAREMFYHERKSYLVVTERWYFFNRRQLTGVHRVVFYQLPSHPLFYSEFINMSQADTTQRFLSVLLLCKYDRMRLENTFGTEMAAAVMANKQAVQAIVSQ
uniref:U3 small nucleolar RNA-associated protein 25 homolog n=2 Tax=Caenorhabditis tropicalis TaxID=1561998 RepID=A0A1I7T378_9PELO